MIKVNRKLMLLAMSLLLFVACDKDEITDTTAPVAIVTAPQAQTYYRGNTLMFSATFTDDTELKECTVYLTQQQSKNTRGWDDPYNPDAVTFPLSGKEDAINDQYLFETSIPFDIMASDYYVVVVTSDQSHNFSTIQIPIHIK